MMGRKIWVEKAFLAAVALGAASCGGGDGGGGGGAPPPTGTPVVCQGTFTNSRTGETREFPCRLDDNGSGRDCIPVPVDERDAVPCAVGFAENGDGQLITLPDFGEGDLDRGFCACMLSGTPVEQQPGSCHSICDEIIKSSKTFEGERDDWSCVASNVPASAKPNQVCEHGSVVYLHGGPSDYGALLVGSQTTSGSVNLPFGVGTISRSASSNLDGWIEFSTGDRSRGCGATGCPLVVSLLGLRIAPFEIEGFSISVFPVGEIFSFGGFSVGDAYLMNQGLLEGVVFDDGSFELSAGGAGRLIMDADTSSGRQARIQALTQPLTGQIDFEGGGISFDSFAVSDGDGQMRVTSMVGGFLASAPRAHIATGGVFECASATATPVVLDATGTVDPDGEVMTFSWQVDGAFAGSGQRLAVDLPFGTSEVGLTARDARLAVGRAAQEVLVQDTTPPMFVEPGVADHTACDPLLDHLVLVPPGVDDSCTGVAELEAWLLVRDGAPLPTPQQLDFMAAPLPGGEHIIEWIARDGAGNESSVRQTVRVGPAVQAISHLELRDRAQVRNGNGVLGAVASIGSAQSQLGVESRVAEILSTGPIFMQNFAGVEGRAASEGEITLQHGAFATFLEPHTTLSFGAIPWLAEVADTAFGSTDVTVPPDSSAVLVESAYGRVQVMSRSSLILPEQIAVRELLLEPDSTLIVPDGIRLVIRDRWIHRGRVVSTAPNGLGEVFVLGDQLLLERPVQGLALIAPNARLTITTQANGTRAPLVVGHVVEIQPDVTLWCDRQAGVPRQ